MFYRVNANWDAIEFDPAYDEQDRYVPVEVEVYVPDREQLLSYLADLTNTPDIIHLNIDIKQCNFITHKIYSIHKDH